jgi:hypothetical protein
MLTIAGGIVLAVLFFALLPYLIVAAGWLIGLGIVAATVGALIFLVWTVGQTAQGLGALFLAAGALTICAHYYVKGRRPLSDEEFARRYPYVTAKQRRAESKKG